MNSITIGDGHETRCARDRNCRGTGGRGIGRNHSVGRVFIHLVTSGSLKMAKFGLVFGLSHFLQDFRWDEEVMVFSIPTNKGILIRRSARSAFRRC